MISIEQLRQKNLWWNDDNYNFLEAKYKKRKLFYKLLKNLDHSLILNILGLRRTGKSTLTKQLISHLLKQNIHPKNIFYFLFDYSIPISDNSKLEEILELYFTKIIGQDLGNIKTRIYIILDEIQYIHNWQAIIKKYYDLSNKKIKFIITGSQSVLLHKKQHESLAGRIFEYYLPVLDFDEFLEIHNYELKLKTTNKFKINLFDISKQYLDVIDYNIKYGNQLLNLSKKYIIYGQFPETKNLEINQNKSEYILESILNKSLSDIVHAFNIENELKFKLMTYQLLNNIGSIFELRNIGQEVGLAKNTIEKYFQYLNDAYILKTLYKKHKSIIKQGRIFKKVYTTSVNFYCALNYYKEEDIEKIPSVFGLVIENLIYNNLIYIYDNQKLDSALSRVSFYRQRDKEIDFLISYRDKTLPIEVKFTRNITNHSFKTLTKYIKEKELDYGVVITKDTLEQKTINGVNLFFIPFYLII